jgi:hypothetical protein
VENIRLRGSRISDLRAIVDSLTVPLDRLDIRQTDVRDLGPLAEAPPRGLYLDYARYEPRELEALIRHWRARGDTTLAYAVEVSLLVSTGEAARAKAMALQFDGHRYLPITLKGTFAHADSICRMLGAHMLTITNARESRFVRQLQRGMRANNVWLGLPRSARPQQWLTGEDVTFRAFNQSCPPLGSVHWYQLEGNAIGWFHDGYDNIEANVIAEWDE